MLTGPELYSRATKSELADFGGEFANFLRSAKRLEAYSAYDVAQESEALQAFRDGAYVDPSFNEDWHAILDSAKGRGAGVERVRMIPDVPNEYVKFEILHGYVGNAEHGERQRFVMADDIAQALGAENPAPDFWLFDDERAYVMVYDARGSFIGVMKVDEVGTVYLRTLFETLTARSQDLSWALNKFLTNS